MAALAASAFTASSPNQPALSCHSFSHLLSLFPTGWHFGGGGGGAGECSQCLWIVVDISLSKPSVSFLATLDQDSCLFFFYLSATLTLTLMLSSNGASALVK